MAPKAQLVNVPSTNQDPWYRYKMPAAITRKEGKGVVFTVTCIINCDDIAKALRRDPEWIVQYIGYALGGKITYSNKEGEGVRALVGGKHDNEVIQGLIDKFIEQFVMCVKCNNPETYLYKSKGKNGIVMGKCASCGFSGDMKKANTHKLGSWLAKRLPSEDQLPDLSKLKSEQTPGAEEDDDKDEYGDGVLEAEETEIEESPKIEEADSRRRRRSAEVEDDVKAEVGAEGDSRRRRRSVEVEEDVEAVVQAEGDSRRRRRSADKQEDVEAVVQSEGDSRRRRRSAEVAEKAEEAAAEGDSRRRRRTAEAEEADMGGGEGRRRRRSVEAEEDIDVKENRDEDGGAESRRRRSKQDAIVKENEEEKDEQEQEEEAETEGLNAGMGRLGFSWNDLKDMSPSDDEFLALAPYDNHFEYVVTGLVAVVCVLAMFAGVGKLRGLRRPARVQGLLMETPA